MRSESVSRRNRSRSSRAQAAGRRPSRDRKRRVGESGVGRARAATMLTAAIAATLVLSGCATTPASRGPAGATDPRDEALTCLKAAIRYPHNPAVRVAAVEALERVPSEDAAAWVRTALTDDHPGVRFAGCMAAGKTSDRVAGSAVRRCLEDPDANVRVGAMFAMHRLGHPAWTTRLATILLTHDDVAVRRHAAFVLGLLGEPGTVKVLARAMKDREKGVRDHALEAMARLGVADARQELVFMTEAGVGSEEVFALSALAATRDPIYTDTFRYKLNQDTHLETRLAAARGLAMLGLDDGFDLALNALQRNIPPAPDSGESQADRLLRVRLMAAAALGATGRAQALPALARVMRGSPDPRIQVAVARAIVEITNKKTKKGSAQTW